MKCIGMKLECTQSEVEVDSENTHGMKWTLKELQLYVDIGMKYISYYDGSDYDGRHGGIFSRKQLYVWFKSLPISW